MSGEKVSSFQERFNELIESSPKSRTVIAQEFHVAKQTISAWLTGQNSPRLPVVAALSEYFSVSTGWLLGYDVPKYIDEKKAQEYDDAIRELGENTKKAGFIFSDELELLNYYRSLSPRGKDLLLERSKELLLLHGKKSESDSAQSV